MSKFGDLLRAAADEYDTDHGVTFVPTPVDPSSPVAPVVGSFVSPRVDGVSPSNPVASIGPQLIRIGGAGFSTTPRNSVFNVVAFHSNDEGIDVGTTSSLYPSLDGLSGTCTLDFKGVVGPFVLQVNRPDGVTSNPYTLQTV